MLLGTKRRDNSLNTWIFKEFERWWAIGKYDKTGQENTDQTDQENRIWLKLTG